MENTKTPSKIEVLANAQFDLLIKKMPHAVDESDRALYVYAFTDGYLSGYRLAVSIVEENFSKSTPNQN